MAVGSNDVYDWIREKVAPINKKVGAPVCPFAEKSVKEQKVHVLPAKVDVLDQIAHCCGLFNVLSLDIVIYYFNYPITEKKMASICRRAHRNHPDYAVMYDHPDNKGLHKGVSFSFEKAPLLMVQKLDKLKQAQQRLKKSGYYRKWGIKDFNQFY